jgi:hypothetical protein
VLFLFFRNADMDSHVDPVDSDPMHQKTPHTRETPFKRHAHVMDE